MLRWSLKKTWKQCLENLVETLISNMPYNLHRHKSFFQDFLVSPSDLSLLVKLSFNLIQSMAHKVKSFHILQASSWNCIINSDIIRWRFTMIKCFPGTKESFDAFNSFYHKKRNVLCPTITQMCWMLNSKITLFYKPTM